MESKSPVPNSPMDDTAKKSDWRSWGLSLLLHVLLLVLLAVFFTSGSGTAGEGESLRSVEVVLTSIEDSEQKFEYQTEEQATTDVTDLSQAKPFDSLPSAQAPELPNVLPDLPGFEVNPQFEVDASQMTATPANANPAEKYELTEEDLKFIAREQAAVRRRAPKGDPVSTQIFGSGDLTGREFVFVIDRSKSMGDSGLGVLDKARQELSTALDALKAEHKFQIIAYHRSTVMIGDRKLLAASDENKRRVPTFIQSLAAFGATRHENGLTAALSFRPDVVVLMTDGGLPELNEGEIKTMLQMAGSRTELHCIQFGTGPNQERDNFMMRLATGTDGSYRYIDVNEWNN